MSARLVRILTTLVVVGLCGPAVLRGRDIVRFSKAEADLGPDGSGTDAVRPWGEISGVAFSAQESSLTVVDDRKDQKTTAKRRDEQTEILAVRALSSEY
jgi:hypothetical protein